MNDRRRSAKSTSSPLDSFSIALTLLVVALWGGNAVAVNFSVDRLPPILVAAARFVLGTLVMLCWCRLEGTSMATSRRELWASTVAGFLLFVQISTFNIGIVMTNSTHGVMLINTYIFMVALIEHFVTRAERMGWRQCVGLALAAIGVWYVMQSHRGTTFGPATDFIRGDLLLLLSAALLAVRVVYVRHVVQTMPPSRLILWHDVLAVVMFFTWSLLTESYEHIQLTPPAVWGLLYQGLVVAGLCFVIQAQLLRRHSASQISIFFFATPVFGVIYSVMLRGEPFTAMVAAGAAFVAAGIGLATSRPSPA